jgi:hypothetical protein
MPEGSEWTRLVANHLQVSLQPANNLENRAVITASAMVAMKVRKPLVLWLVLAHCLRQWVYLYSL